MKFYETLCVILLTVIAVLLYNTQSSKRNNSVHCVTSEEHVTNTTLKDSITSTETIVETIVNMTSSSEDLSPSYHNNRLDAIKRPPTGQRLLNHAHFNKVRIQVNSIDSIPRVNTLFINELSQRTVSTCCVSI